MKMIGPINSGAAAGSAGSATATGTTTHIVSGKVAGVYVRYNDSPPAGTTDATIRTQGTSPACPTYNILALTNAATDGLFLPRKLTDNQAGAAGTDAFSPLPVHDYIEVVIAGANASDSIDVWLFLED